MLSEELLEKVVAFAYSGHAPLVQFHRFRLERRALELEDEKVPRSQFQIYIRQRPRLDCELKDRQERVVKATADNRAVLVHHAKLAHTGKLLVVNHSEWWHFHRVWPERISNHQV
jgi:hypothetical protein